MRQLALLAVVALLSCSDSLGPLTDGEPYALRAINGASLPWSPPFLRPTTQISGGWVKILDDSRAERHERIEAIDSLGAVMAVAEWTHVGSYRLGFGRLIITYEAWQFSTYGPSHPVDTFYVSDKGLLLRETGFIAPLDTLVRYYAP